MSLVSLSGPLTNFAIAGISSVVAHLLYPRVSSLQELLGMGFLGLILGLFINYNLILGIFNLLPIPPLDGSKDFALFLSENTARSYLSIGSMGIFIIFFLLLFPIGGFSLGGLLQQLIQFFLGLLGF